MNSIKRNLIVLFLVALTRMVYAQEFKVPENVVYLTAADYAPYEKDIINCVNWLENTPLNQELYKRKEANMFLMKWINGSPYVIIEVHAEIVSFTDKNPELLMIFMGGWTKFVLENPEFLKDVTKGNLAGLRSAINVYNRNKESGIKKDKNVEKLAQLDGKGELEAWVANQLKK